ncbi:MAG: rhodanese-like domain-containing protein, partial [Bacteroidales bacterium]|nr:rhodanese-like domain-containing protein [Bacteroidales bacterium]
DKGLQGLDKSKTYYLYCRSGRRSNQAANRMLKEGFKVFDMKGGIIEWQKAGLPIVK